MTEPDDVWRKLFQMFPDKPLRAVLEDGDRRATPPGRTWSDVRAKATHLLADPHAVLSPSLAAILRSWTPELAVEVSLAPNRETLMAAFGRCRDRLRSLPDDLLDATETLDAIERELRDAFLMCGDRTAEVMLFTGSRSNSVKPSGPVPTPEERRRAVLFFMGWVSAKLSADED